MSRRRKEESRKLSSLAPRNTEQVKAGSGDTKSLAPNTTSPHSGLHDGASNTLMVGERIR